MLKTERNIVKDQYITGNEMLKTERYKGVDQYHHWKRDAPNREK